MGRIWTVLMRKKTIDPVAAEETRLARVLSTFDLTALGVGSTLGVGVYVLAGEVARSTAGPSVVLSFLIAAIASVFAGLCYAEFGARVPRAGSAYVYTYVCVGEFVAFIIGWNLILEYVIGSASVARGLSLYLDTLLNNTLQDAFSHFAPIHLDYLASYFDFFSFGISVLLAVGLAFGLKESSMANNVVTCLNIAVVLFIVVAGALNADPANWSIGANSTNATVMGAGGFFPWGVEGMIKGAATCFYGFVGFDCIATTGEEVRNPRRAIPISIIVSLLIIFLAYFGVATVLTLMVPYYLQDANAPIPMAFEAVGWGFAKWIVSVGALFGLCASLFGAMFPLPRIIYAMGSDGLLFRILAKVHPRFQTPVVGTVLAGLLTGLMSALFDLNQLVKMMSIGTLQAYTIVAASVLLLRYRETVRKVYVPVKTSSDTESVSSDDSVDDGPYKDDTIRENFDGPLSGDERELLSNSSGFTRSLQYLINCAVKEPTRVTQSIVAVEVLLYCLLSVGVAVCAIYLSPYIGNGDVWAIVLTSVVVGLTGMVVLSMSTQPQSRQDLFFKVPLVPLIPALSILVNVYLMLMLDYHTWVRFAVWMAVGLPMYYICACIPRAVPAPKFYATNGHSKKGGLPRKRAAPPPPVPLDEQQEAALAHLDRVLDTEADRLSNSSGKLSAGSAVEPRFESVVADVHCTVVVTPVADPTPLTTRLLTDSPSLDSGIGDSTTALDEGPEPLDNVVVGQEKPQVSSPLFPVTIGTSQPLDNVVVGQEKPDVAPLTKEPPESIDSVLALPVSSEAPEQPGNVVGAPPEPELAEEPLEPPGRFVVDLTSAVPSADYLKTVNLRHVHAHLKELEPESNPNASDDNLKVGSPEYRNFIRDLDSRLQRAPALVAPNKPATAPPPATPNENVLEEPIDHRGATAMLRNFYAAKTATEAPP